MGGREVTGVSAEQITIELGRDEALVLFELLADFHNQPVLELASGAERLAMIRLHGALERTMVEPFTPEYADLVEGARARLAKEFG